MAVEKIEMYTVVCDHCGEDIGSSEEYSCWADDCYAEENAMESEWLKVEGKHYCPECYEYGDNDELILKQDRKGRNKCGPTIYEEAIALWGVGAQLEMLNEESTELALAVRKFIRVKDDKRFDDMAQEVADAEIMMGQLRTMFPEITKRIDEWKKVKLERLRERIDNQTFES